MNGIIQLGKSTVVKVMFTSPGPKTEDELLTIKIDDGVTLNVNCQGFVTESKCQFQEKLLDFGAVPVGIRTKEEFIHIKNKLRTPAVYHFKDIHEDLQISTMIGKILSNSKQSISCSFISNIMKQFSTEIEVQIRGGNSIKIPIKAYSVVPQIRSWKRYLISVESHSEIQKFCLSLLKTNLI